MIRSIQSPAFPTGFPLAALALFAGIGLQSARADALSDNWAKWQRLRPAHYQYESAYSCFCQPVTYLVEAEGGMVTKAKPVVYSSLPTIMPSLQSHSIDSLFATLKREQAGNPYRFEVIYDREFGFPIRAYIKLYEHGADDDVTYYTSHFKVFPPGLTLANDTVFTTEIANLPNERHVLRFTNTGDSILYLNSIELAVAPTDTFSNGSIGVMFTIAQTPPVLKTFRYGGFGYDTAASITNAGIAPGKDLILNGFKIDPCFCLLKTGSKIAVGDTSTLMLRLDFSRGAPAKRGDIRAYAYVRGIYQYTNAIAGAPAMRKAGTGTFTGWRGGLWFDQDRAFAPNGRRVPAFP